ncbi:phosphoglycerol geranylgeranyltransferase [Pleomorphovibrio marinus]|uniref:phosphoglycerol geranylgeranyltransferase n=1 Tax=Pleomorphovibrio marinus TaxID=2164132 RepID=UPI000E0AA590|nr:phosphoglycerol geranylgeranyltransferase [Pleomorphovibrio marinus]
MKKKNKAVSGILKGLHASGSKGVALLVDPDKENALRELKNLYSKTSLPEPDIFLIGGSFISTGNIAETVDSLSENFPRVPKVLFPGSVLQLCENADGILFLSLISGRNPELLIGQHVLAAPQLSRSDLEVLPTGYLQIEGGKLTSANYISQSIPIPRDKPDLALATAMAGQFLGLKYFYLEAGSGALQPVPPAMISLLKKGLKAPLIVGGGINSVQKAKDACSAGADLIVIGNEVEKNPDFIVEVLHHLRVYNLSLNVN